MKKIVSLIAMAVLLTAELYAQPGFGFSPTPSRDTLPCGQRQRNYLYNIWYDTFDYYLRPYYYGDDAAHVKSLLNWDWLRWDNRSNIFLTRQYTPRPTRIKGLWAMLSHERISDEVVLDTNRLPEYLYLYVRDTNEDIPSSTDKPTYFVRRVATVRWDTAHPKMMCLKQDAEGILPNRYCHVYEAMLDTAITLSGEFWIGGSTNSSIMHFGAVPGLNFTWYYYDHWPTRYKIYGTSVSVVKIENWAINNGRICSEDPDGPWIFIWPDWRQVGPFGAIINDQQWYVEVASADTAQGLGTPTAFYPDSSYQTIRAMSKSCYQFSHWSDGVTDNPRTVFVTQDTTFTAYFDTLPVFNVEVRSNDDSMGYTEIVENRPRWDEYHMTWDDDNRDPDELRILHRYYRRGNDSTFCKWDPAQIRAKARDGYYFWYWNDRIATNHRFVTVTQDTLFTAIFSQDAPPPTCMEVNGMEATVDDSGRVWLSWASGVDGLHVGWEVAWGLDGTPAYQCNTRRCGTATTIDSLEKGQWYVAYLRAICMHDSTEYYSDWSRGVRVYIPLDIKYTVTAVANYEERGYVEGGGVYEEGAIATLTAHAAEPYGFLRWNDGSTANSRYVTVTQDTSFTALFVNRDGVATVDSLGRMFKLLPNPASGSVRCLMEGKPFPGGVLTMADASGRKMLHRELPPLTTSHTITLTAYPKGVYFVTLTTTEGSSTQRLVIE